eukprot:6201055-Pleurochrysis_carterae.AAC.3
MSCNVHPVHVISTARSCTATRFRHAAHILFIVWIAVGFALAALMSYIAVASSSQYCQLLPAHVV